MKLKYISPCRVTKFELVCYTTLVMRGNAPGVNDTVV